MNRIASARRSARLFASALGLTCVQCMSESDPAAHVDVVEPPPDASLGVSAGAACASRANGTCSSSNCGSGEICFTQVACGPPHDGGVVCHAADGDAGDDRCHRECTSNASCGEGEACVRHHFFGCYDYNGFPTGRGICCPREGC